MPGSCFGDSIPPVSQLPRVGGGHTSSLFEYISVI